MSTGEEVKEKRTVSPILALLFSLFAYPGVGHMIVGRRKQGALIALAFTGLTGGMMYQVWAMVAPMFEILLDTTGTVETPSGGGVKLFLWVLGAGVVWAFSGIHSYILASNLRASRKETPQTEPPPSPSAEATHDA